MKVLFASLCAAASLCALAQTPVISSFTPGSGACGTSVTITGSGFSTTALQNKVYVGTSAATVTSATATQLVITVPTAASNDGRLKVVNTATARSVQSDHGFAVTFSGGVAPGTAIQTQYKNANTMTGPSAASDNFQNYFGFRTVSGDFDGDGKIDLAVMGSVAANTLNIYQNNVPTGRALVSGGFALAVTYTLDANTLTAYPYSEDVDNDGKPDLVLSGSAGFTIFKNTSTGTGNFSFVKQSIAIGASYACQKSVLVDLDKDGLPDLVSLRPGSSALLSLFKNTSSGGTISFSTTGINITAPEVIGDVVAGDLDNDGDRDLVISSTSGASVESVYYVRNNNAVTGTINMAGTTLISNTLPAGSYTGRPVGLAISDLDKDGDQDVVSVTKGSASALQLLHIHRNDGALSFSTFSTGNFTATYNITFSVRTADVNGDGKTDILFGEQNTGRLSAVFNNHVSGSLIGTSFSDRSIFPGSGVATGVAVEDFNNDGKVDVITSSYFSGTINLLGNGNLTVLPLQLSAFTAEPKHGKVALEWTTATEQNTRSFTIQHGTNGTSWSDIGLVQAAGNSAMQKSYTYLHSAAAGTHYYRLAQLDLDGKSTYSVIRKVELSGKPASVAIVNSLVTNGALHIQAYKATTVFIYNMTGGLVKATQLAAGSQTLLLNHLVKGVYLVNADGVTERISIL